MTSGIIRELEDRIDCSQCPCLEGCEERGYCMFAVIGPKDMFPPPSIFDLSIDHIEKDPESIVPVSGFNYSNLDLPV